MSRRLSNRTLPALAAGVLVTATMATQGAVISNGTFEATPIGTDDSVATFPNWLEQAGTSNPTSTNSARTNGVNGGLSRSPNGNASGNGAYLLSSSEAGGVLVQSPTGPVNSQWQFDVDFAMVDPGATAARGLQLLLLHDATSLNGINLRINGDGNLVLVSGGATSNTISLGSAQVSFSTDANSDGLLNGGDTVRVNHLRITGNYSGTPSYTVALTNANSVTFTSNALTQSFFLNNVPGSMAAPNRFVSRAMFSGQFSDVGYVIDNVAFVSPIPEPAAIGLVGVAGVAVLARRRGNRA